MGYSPEVVYVQGKSQITADALSRAPVNSINSADLDLINEATKFAKQSIDIIPASTNKLQEIREEQKADDITLQVREYCIKGWPKYMPENPLLKQYWTNRDHFTIVDDLLLFDDRLVIPRSMRLNILNRIHEGHLGITKCCAFARSTVWWPYITSDIEDMIKRCHTCAIHQPEHKEPLLPLPLPDRPWARLGMDLLELFGKNYLLIVDYYSRWMEVKLLSKLTSFAVIQQIKSVFAAQGIPDVVISDNGPQFANYEFTEFATEYGFTHVTSSPKHPQTNGEAERAVKTFKQLLKKNKDPYMALLMYRASPLQNGFSPAELLMGRKLQTKTPVLPKLLKPATPDHTSIENKETLMKAKRCENYNQRHAARIQSPLKFGDSVWIRDMKRHGEVISASDTVVGVVYCVDYSCVSYVRLIDQCGL